MSETVTAKAAPLDKEYLAAFNTVALEDVSPDILARYFRFDEGRLPVSAGDPLFVANSRNSVIRALCSGYEPELLFLKNTVSNLTVMEMIRSEHPKVPVCLLTEDELEALWDNADGIAYSFARYYHAGLFRKKPAADLSEVLQTAKKVVIFRGYDAASEDFRDLGPQIRSAVAFFADAVVFGPGIDPYERGLIRSSVGNIFNVPFAAYDSDAELLRLLRGRGFTSVLISSGDTEGAIPVSEADCSGQKLAVIADRSVQTGQTTDPGLACDLKVYVPGKDVSGIAPCNISIALYSLLAK